MLLGKVVSPEEAALYIKNGMTVGMSGFMRSGEAKAVPLALASAPLGLPFIPVDPDKIVAIVVTDKLDSASTVLPPEGWTIRAGAA